MAITADMLALAAERWEINRLFMPHAPTPKQLAFMAAPEFETLYGGQAGGGKSDAVLMDLAQWVHIPGYAGIALRLTYADLALPGALIDRSHQWWAGTPAAWNGDKKQWRFPSGAIIAFGYMEKDRDKYRYQSSEFQRVDFDELTQFTEAPYLYMHSRCRRAVGIDVPPAVRAASNPGNAGHEWVKRRFINPETRGPRRFIRAGLADNPFIDAGEYARALANLPETERRQLLEGVWETGPVEGSYYGALIDTAYREGRITSVPVDPALPVKTAWDLGMDDCTSIVLYQDAHDCRRYVDHYENNGEPLSHYVEWLRAAGYNYGRHTLPHDANVRELGTGKTRVEVLAAMGMRADVLPASSVADGIDALRRILETCYIDETRCAGLVSALRNYRREWNDKTQTYRTTPRHDWSSHTADAARYSAMDARPASHYDPLARFKSARRPDHASRTAVA